MAEYTKEDKKRFIDKDLQIARQNALRHATKLLVELGCGEGVSPVEEIIKSADLFLKYIYEGNGYIPPDLYSGVEDEPKSSPQPKPKETKPRAKATPKIPKPTTAQKKIITEIRHTLDESADVGYVCNEKLLCDSIYKKFGQYPNNPKSIQTILDTLDAKDMDSPMEFNDFPDDIPE